MATTSVEALAAHLSMSEEDLRVILAAWTEVVPDDLDSEMIDAVAGQLDPHGERTAPAGLYWPGADDDDEPPAAVNPLAL